MVANSKIGPLLVIVGETSSGKTELAITLAKHFDGEIICADSWTVRREADIGAAKPTAEQRVRVPHHLLDVVGPDEDFIAAVFKRIAKQAVEDISARGKLPIMVGGTGLYIDGVLYDYGFLPAGDRTMRKDLNKLSPIDLLQIITDTGLELGDVDTGNKRRLIRLIEVNGEQPTRQPLRQNTLILGIRLDREMLEKRVIARVDGMIAAGLEGEVRSLVQRFGWDCEVLKGISYAQWRGYFEGRETYEVARLRIIKATLDLAKRQRTWFKRNKSIHWLSTPVNQIEVVDLITTFLHS